MSGRIPPPPPNYDTIELTVYGTTRMEMRDTARQNLANLLGEYDPSTGKFEGDVPKFTLEIEPFASSADGSVATWKATVRAEIPSYATPPPRGRKDP